jgi:signal peptidase I
MANNTNPFDYTTGSVAPSASGSKRIVDVLQIVVLIAAVLVVLYLFFIIPTQVNGQSMERNFLNDEVLLTNRLLQIAGGPSGLVKGYDYQRGDVVVFMRKDEPDLIKRIIGMPGERVMIKNNHVWINGVELREDYIPEDKPTQPGTFIAHGEEKVVPAGSYFALGDNRINSIDSRTASVGFVKREQLRGGPFLRILPLNRFGPINRPTYNI